MLVVDAVRHARKASGGIGIARDPAGSAEVEKPLLLIADLIAYVGFAWRRLQSSCRASLPILCLEPEFGEAADRRGSAHLMIRFIAAPLVDLAQEIIVTANADGEPAPGRWATPSFGWDAVLTCHGDMASLNFASRAW